MEKVWSHHFPLEKIIYYVVYGNNIILFADSLRFVINVLPLLQSSIHDYMYTI